MNPRFWFVPSPSGDFRLERKDDGLVLTVENPTNLERERLDRFFTEARSRGWIPADSPVDVHPKGTSVIPIRATMPEAGPLLTEIALDGSQATWTAVRSSNGEITVVDGNGTSLIDRAKGVVQEVAGKVVDAVAAVTVKAPGTGCPAPEPAVRRASQVLRMFSTEDQWRMFQQYGWMPVIGNATGVKYKLFHRGEAHARHMSHVLLDTSVNAEVCAWDESVPAEEEMLALKLAVEHREAWLRRLAVNGVIARDEA